MWHHQLERVGMELKEGQIECDWVKADKNSNSVTTLGYLINPHGNHKENNIGNTHKKFKHFTSKKSPETKDDRIEGNEDEKQCRAWRKQIAEWQN